jgi:predicted nucleic-acid-binding Zn-ribbon protein
MSQKDEDTSTKPNQSLSVQAFDSRDGVAMIFLKDFIRDGFPAPDPERQIVLAYMYADAMIKFKEMQRERELETRCKKCGNPELHSTLANTTEFPHQYILMCKKCGWQETFEK